tara:strand:- start:6557 stop:7267 length:711 start_codon:yes stop_codon:yes gene_type:complete
MDYNKISISGYTGIQLFINNFIYFFILVLVLTDIRQIDEVIQSSVVTFFVSIFVFYFLLSKYDLVLNLPNQITLFRFVINIFIFVITLNIDVYSLNLLLILSIISMSLDGIDGYTSRYLNQTTKFGEVFDQEVDNFLIFILTISLIINHDYNYYIIIVPIYRYVFQLSKKLGLLSNDDLPDSFLRKFICVAMTMILVLCNCFNTVHSFNTLLYVIILLLSYSFIKDSIWLYRRKND